jgi:AraC family transcriptional regulator
MEVETKKVGIVKRLIPPEMIPAWIPGQQTVDSSHLAWDGLTLKGYNYASQQARIPAMRDYMIVIYRGGRSMMRRRSGGDWKTSTVEQGVITFVTRCEESEWHWTNPIDVRHIYLGHDALLKTAEEVFEHDFSSIQIDDIVGSKDDEFAIYLDLLEMELNNQGIGDSLYIDSLRTQLCIHTLRKYARISFREIPKDGLSRNQKKIVLDYIACHLDKALKIDELASLVGLSAYHFARRFKVEFGVPPHGFVLDRRVERAKGLMGNTGDRLKSIAVDCGFSDQSHLTRVFKKRVGLTPGEFRRKY